MSDKSPKELLAELYGECLALIDSCRFLYYTKSGGKWSASNDLSVEANADDLRAIADELDRRNGVKDEKR